MSMDAGIEEIENKDFDLFNPLLLPPNPTGPQVCSALRKKSDAAILQAMLHTMDIDNKPPAGQSSSSIPPSHQSDSTSHHLSAAAPDPLT